MNDWNKTSWVDDVATGWRFTINQGARATCTRSQGPVIYLWVILSKHCLTSLETNDWDVIHNHIAVTKQQMETSTLILSHLHVWKNGTNSESLQLCWSQVCFSITVSIHYNSLVPLKMFYQYWDLFGQILVEAQSWDTPEWKVLLPSVVSYLLKTLTECSCKLGSFNDIMNLSQRA